ncbi:MAG: hypothetical protein H7Z14_11015 [Anaerolineae bacterium]|nr:hypothetical protein [Phycisphaerae bacterium]
MKISRCRIWAVAMIYAPLALALLGGCESQDKPATPKEEFFAAENDARIPRQIADHQAMLGAQADPTLYRCHFDGNNLNALGKAKLDALIANGAPARIYVDGGRDSTDGHRAAVNSYLAAAKVADGSVAIESGAAPASSSSAAPALARMGKTENPRSGSAGGTTSADNSSMGSGSGMTTSSP